MKVCLVVRKEWKLKNQLRGRRYNSLSFWQLAYFQLCNDDIDIALLLFFIYFLCFQWLILWICKTGAVLGLLPTQVCDHHPLHHSTLPHGHRGVCHLKVVGIEKWGGSGVWLLFRIVHRTVVIDVRLLFNGPVVFSATYFRFRLVQLN